LGERQTADILTGEQESDIDHEEEVADSEQQASEGELSDATIQQAILSHDPARIAEEEDQMNKLEADAFQRTKELEQGILDEYSASQQQKGKIKSSDSRIRLMRDQLIMARAYTYLAQATNHVRLVHDLKFRIKDYQKTLADCNFDSELPRGAQEKMKAMGQLLERARQQHYDLSAVMKKLRAMLQSAEDQARTLQKHSNFLNQLAAKAVPKGLHCLSMRLMVEYHTRFPDDKEFVDQEKLEDPRLYQYSIFSDNVLAAGVVVNSTIFNAKEAEKHVFHVVTDNLNYGAMKVWFLVNPPGNATIHVQNIDDFKWLNSSYCPVLRQLESATMKEYYFKADRSTGSANLKFRNPKYLSMLNHLRFYLPEVFPKLDKILFLDDDVVVQKDLTPLWNIDLRGKVNGAVETCGPSFHRFDKYLNFSNPHISKNFNPRACGWAYGMNVFDLKEWKKKDITGIYHRWQSMNEDRNLWKLGTLPPGLITFYNRTHALDKSWHVLGLGYNPNVAKSAIVHAAAIHYNGNMKPWLEIAMAKYKPYWSKYVKFDHPYLQQCNINA
jgi:alpha-1,4-galacturonosyltransferase